MATPRSKADPVAMDVDQEGPAENPEQRLAAEQASRLRELATKVEDFVEGEGDLEGAKFEESALLSSSGAVSDARHL